MKINIGENAERFERWGMQANCEKISEEVVMGIEEAMVEIRKIIKMNKTVTYLTATVENDTQ